MQIFFLSVMHVHSRDTSLHSRDFSPKRLESSTVVKRLQVTLKPNSYNIIISVTMAGNTHNFATSCGSMPLTGCQLVQWGNLCTERAVRVQCARALHAHCALLLDYVPPEEPPSTPLGDALRIR